jgi:hypothetical protein
MSIAVSGSRRGYEQSEGGGQPTTIPWINTFAGESGDGERDYNGRICGVIAFSGEFL